MDQEFAKQAEVQWKSYIKPLIIVGYLLIRAADSSVQTQFISEKQVVEYSLEILESRQMAAIWLPQG